MKRRVRKLRGRVGVRGIYGVDLFKVVAGAKTPVGVLFKIKGDYGDTSMMSLEKYFCLIVKGTYGSGV